MHDLEQALRRAVRLLPPHRAGYGDALVAELAAIPENHRARWILGGLWFVAMEVLMRPVLYSIGLGGAVALLVWVDRSSSDVANQSALLVLLISAGGLGFTTPRRAWLTALVIGGSLAAGHGVYQALDLPLPYPSSPAGWAGPATLLLLIAPACLAAFLGSAAAKLLRRSGTVPPTT